MININKIKTEACNVSCNTFKSWGNKIVEIIVEERKTAVVFLICYVTTLCLNQLYMHYFKNSKIPEKKVRDNRQVRVIEEILIESISVNKIVNKKKFLAKILEDKQIQICCKRLFDGSSYSIDQLPTHNKIIKSYCFHSLLKSIDKIKQPIMKGLVSDGKDITLCVAIKIHQFSTLSSKAFYSVLFLQPVLVDKIYIWKQVDHALSPKFLSDPSVSGFYGDREIPSEFEKVQRVIRRGTSSNLEKHNWLVHDPIWYLTLKN